MRRRDWILGGLAGVLLLGQGCAGVGVTLLGIAAGTATSQGVGHTLDSITYKTFTVPIEGLEKASVMTLNRMDFAVEKREDVETGRRLLARSPTREVDVELERLTARATRMRVVAKQNWLLRDRATATEIILQTDQTLIDNPQLAAFGAAARPAARPAAK